MQVISLSAKLHLKFSYYRQNDRNTLWKPRKHAFIGLSNQSNALHSAVENGKRSGDDLRAPGVIIQRRLGFDRFTVMSYCVLAKPVLSGQKEARGEIYQNQYEIGRHLSLALSFALSFISAITLHDPVNRKHIVQ